MTPSGFSLKFISGKYQGGEFALPEDREVLVGRASDIDMVLMEDMVSRHHARLVCHGGEVTIEDLGSTNGTFVNGERVERTRLKAGDRVLIGTSIVRVIPRTEWAHSRMKSLALARQEDATEDGDKPNALSGRIEDISLPDLLQLLSASRKTGVLAVRGQRQRGRIVLEEGRVVSCSIAGREHLDPRKAFYRMLTWSSGGFALQGATDEVFEQPMAESTEALLMEGVRQLDELKHLEPELPKSDDILVLQLPILPPLRSLTPELLDTLQLVHNLGQVEAILDQSAASDLDTCEELLYLIRHRYVRLA